jgi:hypothetical protein
MLSIDYCVIVINEVKSFVQLQFDSLVKEMPEVFTTFKSFHIVNKNTQDGVIDYCKDKIPSVVIHELDYYTVQGRTGTGIGSDWQWDWAYSYQYAVENCGDSEWILLCHPDIVYGDPRMFFEALFKLMGLDVGVIWNVGFLLIRREAYHQSHFGFWPLFGTVCSFNVADKNNGQLLHLRDERRTLFGDVVSITGIEAGHIFFAELQSLGWKSVSIPHELRCFFGHFSGCTEHDRDRSSSEDCRLWNEKTNLVKTYLGRI